MVLDQHLWCDSTWAIFPIQVRLLAHSPSLNCVALHCHCSPLCCWDMPLCEACLTRCMLLDIASPQDFLAIDGDLRAADAASERINVPAIAQHYWRWRMHLTLEDLCDAAAFNKAVRAKVVASGRLVL